MRRLDKRRQPNKVSIFHILSKLGDSIVVMTSEIDGEAVLHFLEQINLLFFLVDDIFSTQRYQNNDSNDQRQ